MKRPPEGLAAKLLAASAQLGVQGVDLSIDEMARESGVPRATLYYYFTGKDDLVAFLLDDKVSVAAAAMEKAVAYEGSAPERLERLVLAVFTAMAGQPALCLEMPTAMRNPDAFGDMMSHAERVVFEPMRRVLEEGVDSDEFTIGDIPAAMTFMQGALWHTAMVKLAGGDALDPDALTCSTMPLLLGAVGATA